MYALNTRDTLASSIQKPFEFIRLCCNSLLFFCRHLCRCHGWCCCYRHRRTLLVFFLFSPFFYRFCFSFARLLLSLSFLSFWFSLLVFFHLLITLTFIVYFVEVPFMPHCLYACACVCAYEWKKKDQQKISCVREKEWKINKTQQTSKSVAKHFSE